MSTKGTALAGILLENVPERQHAEMLQDITTRLVHVQPSEAFLATAELVAEVLHLASSVSDQVLADMRQHLIKSLCANIDAFVNDEDMQALHKVLELCQQYEWIYESFFFLSQRGIGLQAEKAILLLANSSVLSVEVNSRDACERMLRNHSLEHTSILQGLPWCNNPYSTNSCIVFLKFLIRFPQSYSSYSYDYIFTCLWLISVGDDMKLACAAKQSLVTVIDAFKGPNQEEFNFENSPRAALWRSIWSEIIDITADSSHPWSFYALTIWLRILNSPAARVQKYILSTDERYWSTIRDRLATGSQQCRKILLSILSVSLSHIKGDISMPQFKFNSAERFDYERQYHRYITLFDTIVLGRYLNQIQECIGDLEVLRSGSCKVHKSFFFALLAASLSDKMQESIRGFIGTWLLERGGLYLVNLDCDLPNLLSNSFLPWALQGHLCVSSTRKDGLGHSFSSHGEQLSHFLSDMLINAIHDEEKNELVSAMLNHIAAYGRHIFPYSRAYALQGIINGIRKDPPTSMVKNIVAIMDIFCSAAGFAEAVRDLTVVQCHRLILLCNREHIPENAVESLIETHNLLLARIKEPKGELQNWQLQLNLDKIITIDPATKDEADPNLTTLNSMAKIVKNTRAKCFQGKRFQSALSCLRGLLEAATTMDLQAQDLETILQAIWNEAEVQDYPKQCIMALPTIFLLPICIEACRLSSTLKDLIRDSTRKLQKLAENRVYVFTAFAESMRRVCFTCPKDGKFLFEDFIVWFVNMVPCTKVEFELEAVMATKLSDYVSEACYESYYGQKEEYGHACVFHMLNNFPFDDCEHAFGILDRLLQPWIHQSLPVPVFSKWKRSAQLQAMLLLCERCPMEDFKSRSDYYMAVFLDLIALEPLPRFRFLLEWILVRLFIRIPSRRGDLLCNLSNLDISNPKLSVSLMKIAMMVACLPDAGLEFSSELISLLVTLAASPKIVIRHEAQWIFPILWDHVVKKDWTTITQCSVFARLNSWIRSLEAYKNPPSGRLQEQFNPIENHTLTDLFQGSYLKIEPREPERTSRDCFLLLEDNLSLGCYVDKSYHPSLPIGPAKPCSPSKAVEVPEQTLTSSSPEVASLTTPLQMKSMRGLENSDLSYFYSMDSSRRRKKHIIVVASLLENAYNLGGLSRVSEIFGASTLYVNNLNVTKNKEFISVAVASQLHLTINELNSRDISRFLHEQKLQGWTVVGIEQTDKSKILGHCDCMLPEKSVLLIGGERRGIPGAILGDLDLCVEIKQFGLTRSMNVQTAAAVFLYEYTKQNP